MIEVKINDDGCPDYAFIRAGDLRVGRKIIYLGGDMEEFNQDLKTDLGSYVFPTKIKEWLRSESLPADALIYKEIDKTLSHEATHIAIYKATNSLLTVVKFDKIDNVGARLIDFQSLR